MVNIPNTKSYPYISPRVYKPPHVQAHQKVLTNEYKPRAYIRRFTVYAKCQVPAKTNHFSLQISRQMCFLRTRPVQQNTNQNIKVRVGVLPNVLSKGSSSESGAYKTKWIKKRVNIVIKNYHIKCDKLKQISHLIGYFYHMTHTHFRRIKKCTKWHYMSTKNLCVDNECKCQILSLIIPSLYVSLADGNK